MPRKPKAHILPHSTKVAIAKYKEKYPKATVADIAGQYKCTSNQVRSALEQHKLGNLMRTPPKQGRKAVDIKKSTAPEELFNAQFHLALSQLESDDNINVSDRVILLDKLSGIQKNIRQMNLEAHLKSKDAGLIANIIRRFMPEATNEQIIFIYREELEKWKISQQ